MNNRNEKLNVSALSAAVLGALVAMFAVPTQVLAADPTEDEIALIRRPTNFVEIGAQNVTRQDAKFGEYNGLDKSGGIIIGNFSLKGGDAYLGGNGIQRWSITGRDLGTTSRELAASLANQGRWHLNFGYDELRHNITDTYQTPQTGSMGGNVFTLPANFPLYNGATNAVAVPVAPALASTRGIPASALHTEQVSSTRKNTSFGAGFHINPQWNVQFDYNQLTQSGAKLMASATQGTMGTGVAGSTWRAESIAVLMNPTNYKTDTFNLALNWVGEQGHLSGSFHRSSFRDGYDRLSWQNSVVSAATNTANPNTFQTTTMSTAPSNDFHQFNLVGGYAFSPSTKLAGGVSYGVNTQNDAFLTGLGETPLPLVLPQASLNGKVVTRHLDLKLSHQVNRDLSLAGSFKYNERDNRSPSAIYNYYALNDAIQDRAANAPYSNKKTEYELAGDYRIDKRQSIRLAYNLEDISRWCNSYAIVASNCLVSPASSEDKFSAKYKIKASNDVSLNAGYSHARRKATFDHNAITPLSGLAVTALVTNSLTLVNAQDYPGFVAFNYASRKQDVLKLGMNWQASEKLELSAEARHASDKYFESTLGVQGNRATGINLDATYTLSEDTSYSAYLSWQNSKKDMRIGAAGGLANNVGINYALLVAPINAWSNQLTEVSNALGLASKHRLMGGRLELTGDLSYTFDKSQYSTQVPYLLTCGATNTLSCGDVPDIKSTLVTLKINGIYAVDKKSKVSVGYMYQQLSSQDYAYNWFQLGATGTRGMPTNQQAPTYSVNVLAASYIYNFK